MAHSIKRDTPRIIILINIRRPIRRVLARDCCSIKCGAEVGFKFQIGRQRGRDRAPFSPTQIDPPPSMTIFVIKNCVGQKQRRRVLYRSLLPVRINELRINHHPRGGIIFSLFFIVFTIVFCVQDTFSLCQFMNLWILCVYILKWYYKYHLQVEK